jgi:hypothetical protein
MQPRSVDSEAEAFQDPARNVPLDDHLDDAKPAVALRALPPGLIVRGAIRWIHWPNCPAWVCPPSPPSSST